MATNDILKFGDDASNILGQSAYAADTDRTQGVSGKARSNLQNKFQRQMSVAAAGLSQFIADYNSGGDNVVDTLSAVEYAALLLDALSNAPLTTQPQFDNSTKAATTEFVNRAAGSFADLKIYTTNTALTTSDAGCLVLPSAAGLGFALPLSSTVPDGTKIYFNGNGHGCAITKTGSDVINNGSQGALTSISLLEQDSVTVVSIGAGWSVIEGELHQAVSSSFAGSLATGGWKRLPGGLILQWDTGSTVSGTVTKSFPTSFTNSCFAVTVNSNVSENWSNNECTIFGVDSATLTNTSYTINSRLIQSGTVTLNSNSFNMIAIGY